jgi:hypothetical protein
MPREELIRRKTEVQAEIERLRRQIDTLSARGDLRRILELQRDLEAYMAEEMRLRQLIDRSK